MPALVSHAGSRGVGNPSLTLGRNLESDRRHSNPRRMAPGKACDPESPGFRRGLFVCLWRVWSEKPRVENRGHAAREPAASCRGSLGGPAPAWNQPGPPGLVLTQEAPGGNPGTPGMKTTPPSMPDDDTQFLGLKPTSHGTWEGMRPGVPRLPPGASWAVRACQTESKTRERATSKDALEVERETRNHFTRWNRGGSRQSSDRSIRSMGGE